MSIEIKQLEKEKYAGKKFTAYYQTNGYYDIRKTDTGFEIKYVPFEKPQNRSFDDEFYSEWLEEPIAYGAFDSDKLIGYVEGSIETWNKRFRISNICIFEKTYRCQGIGKALLDRISEYASKLDVRMLVLETQSANEKAIKFYKENGFDIIGFDLYCYSNDDIKDHNIRIEMGKVI